MERPRLLASQGRELTMAGQTGDVDRVSEVNLPDGRTLEVRTEIVEVTRGGLLGGLPPDPIRSFAPGVTRYFLDAVEITRLDAVALVEGSTTDPATP